MSVQTPRQRAGLQRPSYGSSPSSLSASTAVNRKASLQALTGQSPDPRTPSTNNNKLTPDLEVGDAVNVPGEMYGVVRFIGSVRGKNGVFVGVELDGRFASKGKNSGDVDGVKYFTTSQPGAGIFLPIHRAARRFSPAASVDSYSNSPNTPTYSTVNGVAGKGTPPTPYIPAHKFSQTVGPGVRPSSPNFKPKRPSLPRPESPLRRQPPSLAPTPARTLSASTNGRRPGLTPAKSNTSFKSSTSTRSTVATTPRPYSRTGSRLGSRNDNAIDEDLTPVGAAMSINSRTTSQSSVPSFSQPLRSPSRVGSSHQDPETQRLRLQLAERDRRLEDQAASLAEMEQSVKELSALLPSSVTTPEEEEEGSGQSVAQLRQMLREKNEKISLLTAEFDAHRADFRSTLDSLEMASTETERVYEEQKRDLLAQLAELQDLKESREDFEGITRQLKQLEDLVQELEDGLEESRRGEAEARGEVEFLRGEVERTRSELGREREKSASGGGGGGGTFSQREIEAKEDEIRGLKAIIHRLSDGQGTGGAEVERLREEVEQSRVEREALEREIEELRRQAASSTTTMNGHHARNESERTATVPSSPTKTRHRAETVKAARLPDRSNGLAEGLFCEMCASTSHDTLDCTSLKSNSNGSTKVESPGKENDDGSAGGGKVADEEKWCALCEKDGHLAFDCPEEQY